MTPSRFRHDTAQVVFLTLTVDSDLDTLDSMPITLNEALRGYYTQRVTRLAGNTQRNINTVLSQWQNWVHKETQFGLYVHNIDDMLMSRYVLKIMPPHLAPQSFNIYRATLFSFWKYCCNKGWVIVNPMQFVDALPVPHILRTQLSAAELVDLLQDAEPRDRYALAVGMNTGLRAQDAMGLKVGDANLTNGRLYARVSKTQTEDYMPMSEELEAETVRWLEGYAEMEGFDSIRDIPNEYTLIPALTRTHGVLRARRYSRIARPEEIVQRGLERLGLPLVNPDGTSKREGFHTLRRSAGRCVFDLAVAEGVGDPIRVAMTFLGHKSQATTEHYLGISHEKRQRDELLHGQSFLGRLADLDQQRAAARETSGLKVVRHA